MTKEKYVEYAKVNRCPSCGSKGCWDLDNNQHETDIDTLIYSCECGAIWIETWKLENVFITDNKFFSWSSPEFKQK